MSPLDTRIFGVYELLTPMERRLANVVPEAIEKIQQGSGTHGLMRLRHHFGTFAYTMTPLAAQALLRSLLPLRQRAVGLPGFPVNITARSHDILRQEAYPGLRAYVCVPPLAVQDVRLPAVRLQVA